MAHLSKIFEEQPIRVQNVNGFDLSHMASGTTFCGTLTPCLCKLLMQHSRFSLGCNLEVQLPPLSTTAFGRIDAKIEVFFVRCSILYGGWRQFISNNPPTSFTASQLVNGDQRFELPRFAMNSAIVSVLGNLENQHYCLLPYLRFRWSAVAMTGQFFSMLPALCYHKIWDCYYRNPNVTRTIFAVNPNPNGPGWTHNVSYVHHSFYSYLSSGQTLPPSPEFITAADLTFPDGVSLFSLRQRNYPRDYFTAGQVDPQMGSESGVSFQVDSSGNGSISIPALRLANSLQRFTEVAGYDMSYRGVMLAQMGSVPDDADFDEPQYLGRLVVPVYQRGVYVSGGGFNGTGGNNPFVDSTITDSVVGAKAGDGHFSGEGSIVHDFKVGSFGFLFANFSLVPHAQYSYGIDRMWKQLDIDKFPFPNLQNVGMDGVKEWEIYPTSGNIISDADFCYLPRYSSEKYIDDWVAGELTPGKSLDMFILQRKFSSVPQFSTAFLEIGIGDLDNILATSASAAGFSCWYQIFWVFKYVAPLAEFCIPTLGDMTEDTHEIRIPVGGSRL